MIFLVQERLLEAGYKRSMSEQCCSSFWPSFILGDTLRIVFQNLLLESNEAILQCSERVWRLLVQVVHNLIRGSCLINFLKCVILYGFSYVVSLII